MMWAWNRVPWPVVLLVLLVTRGLACTDEDGCWLPAASLDDLANCTTTPISGSNLAFPAFQNLGLDERAVQLLAFLQAWRPAAWLATTDPIDYHVSIDYLPCLDQSYTAPVASALRSFAWHSFSVALAVGADASVCCEPDYIEWCLDPPSQTVMRNFSLALRHHLASMGIPIRFDLDGLQPPFHISLATVNTTLFDPRAAFAAAREASGPGNGTVSVRLDTFYFGTTVYLSVDAATDGGLATWVIALICVAGVAVLLLVAAILFWLCRPRLCPDSCPHLCSSPPALS